MRGWDVGVWGNPDKKKKQDRPSKDSLRFVTHTF